MVPVVGLPKRSRRTPSRLYREQPARDTTDKFTGHCQQQQLAYLVSTIDGEEMIKMANPTSSDSRDWPGLKRCGCPNCDKVSAGKGQVVRATCEGLGRWSITWSSMRTRIHESGPLPATCTAWRM